VRHAEAEDKTLGLMLFLGSSWYQHTNVSMRIREGSQRRVQLSREDKVAVVDAYLKGLAGKDISKVPFAMDITFEGPRVPPLAGREAVVGFLSMIPPAIKDIQIKQHIVEGDYVATVFDMETTDGIDRVFDRIRVVNDELKEIHSFYYPQPLLARG